MCSQNKQTSSKREREKEIKPTISRNLYRGENKDEHQSFCPAKYEAKNYLVKVW